MNKEAQRIAIAESSGWEQVGLSWYSPIEAHPGSLPDYLNDLNEMHEAEKILFAEQSEMCNYENRLNTMTGNWSWSATAAQRAEAFLKTFNLWEEGE
jgi:hypothetical protein